MFFVSPFRLMNEDDTSVRLASSSNHVFVSCSIAFFDSLFGANDIVLPTNCPITLKLRQAKVIIMLNLKANCLIIILFFLFLYALFPHRSWLFLSLNISQKWLIMQVLLKVHSNVCFFSKKAT